MTSPGVPVFADDDATVASFRGKLSIWAGLSVVGAALALSDGGWPAAGGIVLLGLMYAHGLELMHQCIHDAAFRDPAWNRAVGTVLGLPVLYAFSDYRAKHFEHHRLLGTAANEDVVAFATMSAAARYFAMVPHFRQILRTMLRALGQLAFDRFPFRARLAPPVIQEYALIAAFLAALIAGIWFAPRLVMMLWLLPLAVAVPVHAALDLVAHWRCASVGAPSVTTRTIETGLLGRWFTNGNNFHVEHHLWPELPPEMLRHAHRGSQPDCAPRGASYATLLFRLAFTEKRI
ncbi:MAG TPA: fatty acid desaturase [Stellaceae bacterium]